MAKSIDELILESIEKTYKTVTEISDELKENPVRIYVRMKKLRKRKLVNMLLTKESDSVRGVKPIKYKKRMN